MKAFKTSTGTFVYSDNTNFFAAACFSPATDNTYFSALGEISEALVNDLTELSGDSSDDAILLAYDNALTTLSNVRLVNSDELAREKADQLYKGISGL